MKQLISKTVYLNYNTELISTINVEQQLYQQFENIVRWAIVEVLPDKLKICITVEA